MLFPKIEEKTDSLRNQLEEAWKIAKESVSIVDLDKKYLEGISLQKEIGNF